MKTLKIFTSIRLVENLSKSNPSDKLLTFTFLVSEGTTIYSSVVYEQECHINKTSDFSGILEADSQQQESFRISPRGISLLLNFNQPTFQLKGSELNSYLIPENFLLHDSKRFGFLLSQNKSDNTFFETQTPYLVFQELFLNNFFESVRNHIKDDLFPNLQENDIIEIHNI